MSKKLSVVPSGDELPPMSDCELDEQIVILLEDNRRLRHELKNKRYSYDLAMQINNRQRLKINDLEATIKMVELCNAAFSPQPQATTTKLKIAA